MITARGQPAYRGNHKSLKHQSVVDYNAHKAGVDKQDQMSACYPMSRKIMKWWKKIFFVSNVDCKCSEVLQLA